MLPLTFSNKKIAKGKNIKLTKEANLLKPYWELVKDFTEYQLYFELDKVRGFPCAVYAASCRF